MSKHTKSANKAVKPKNMSVKHLQPYIKWCCADKLLPQLPKYNLFTPNVTNVCVNNLYPVEETYSLRTVLLFESTSEKEDKLKQLMGLTFLS